MGVNCIICGDCFVQSSKVVLNKCGHAFHDACLYQWLERSKTCPHCRAVASQRTIQKVFFNFANTDNTEDVGTLRSQLDDAILELRIEKSKITKLEQEANVKNDEIFALKENSKVLEEHIKSLKLSVSSLKDEVKYYKDKGKLVDQLRAEVESLNNELTGLKYVETALHGSRDGVYEILQNERDINKIILLTSTLKKALINEEKIKNDLQTQNSRLNNVIDRYRKRYRALKCENGELKKNLSTSKNAWDEEKLYLKQKLENLNKNDASVHRILTESPAPLPRNREEIRNPVVSPPANSKVDLNESVVVVVSPMLPPKTNYTSLFRSIHMKPKTLLKSETKEVRPSSSTVYNGFGGQEKQDSWDFSVKKVGLKRHKTTSSLTSSKFKKLTANPTSRKITEYVVLDDSI